PRPTGARLRPALEPLPPIVLHYGIAPAIPRDGQEVERYQPAARLPWSATPLAGDDELTLYPAQDPSQGLGAAPQSLGSVAAQGGPRLGHGTLQVQQLPPLTLQGGGRVLLLRLQLRDAGF